jgi:hypothetical protein
MFLVICHIVGGMVSFVNRAVTLGLEQLPFFVFLKIWTNAFYHGL